MRYFAVVIIVGLIGCPAQQPAVSPTPGPVASASSAPVPTVVPAPSSSSGLPVVEPDPAGIKAPVFSDDDCNVDKDCAGVNTCHPDRCVALANAGTMPTGMMCTMDCRGGTLDCGYNHCGCAPNAAGKKKCAMLAGPPRKTP